MSCEYSQAASTRWVRIPMISSDNRQAVTTGTSPTSARRRSTLPDRLGPWPLKRSFSEDDCDRRLCRGIADSLNGAVLHNILHAPSLASVLKDIDAECDSIDQALKNEAIFMESAFDPEEQMTRQGRSEDAQDGERTNSTLPVILIAAAVLMFASTSMLTFVFAQPAWGGVQPPAQAPSRTVLAVLLTLVSMSTGMVWIIAVVGILGAKKAWPVPSAKNATTAGALGTMMGVTLTS